MSYGAKSVGTSATLIVNANSRRRVLLLTNNNDTGVCYLGPDGAVTTSSGTPLYENQTRGDTKDFGCWLGPVYGITDSDTGTVDIRFWEVEGN